MPYGSNKGVKIYYEVNGQGFPLVMIHANPFDHNLWTHQIRYFSKHFKIIAPDLRGYGLSDKPATEFSLKDMADDVLSVCRDAGVTQAVVMGASVGSAIALSLAIDHAEMVKALILVGGNRKGGERIEDRIRGYTETGIDKYRRVHMQAMFAPAFRESEACRELLEMFEKTNSQLSAATIAQIFRARAKADLTPHLPHLKVPALVINGELDNSLQGGAQTAQKIPGAVHKILLGTGHACCIENPAVFNSMVEEFLAEHGFDVGEYD